MRIIVDEAIHLTEVRPTDTAALVEFLSDKEIYDRTLRIPHPYTEADADHWLKLVAQAAEQNGQPVHFAIRNESGRMIGGCGFDGVDIGKSHRGELGYWLAKPSWGGGIMTRAVGHVCRFAFAEFGLAKIVAHVLAINTASARVLEKNGFVQEGCLRSHYLKDGKFIDAKLYGLLPR